MGAGNYKEIGPEESTRRLSRKKSTRGWGQESTRILGRKKVQAGIKVQGDGGRKVQRD